MSARSVACVGISLLLTSSFSCSVFRHSSKSAAMPGTWQAVPIAIDGDSKDWPSPYPNYDAKAFIAYATSNDRDNLYITMETGDEVTQLKILRQGMTVSIDTSGGKNTSRSINFPLVNDNELELPSDQALVHMSPQFKQKLYKQAEFANQFSIEGFPDCNGGYLATQTAPCGIKVRMRIDEFKQLVWEAQVPFKALYGTTAIPPDFAGKKISVCYTVKGFKRNTPKGTDNTSSSSNMDQNMGGATIGGNSRQGGLRTATRTAESPVERMYETTKTWKHFGLEYK
ncbi:MAG: hypothetical protein V4649_00160 [Bacteroidota bacterium]